MLRTALIGILVCSAAAAGADTLQPGSGQYGEITRLGRGIAELGLENLLIIRSNSETTKAKGSSAETEASTFATVFVGGPTFRYFLIDNLSLSINANLYVQHSSTETKSDGKSVSDTSVTEMGILGTVMAEYAVSMGRGMFLRPALGGGGFYTSQETPVEVNGKELKQKTSRAGGAARAQVGLVYYTSAHFNLRAAVDVLMQFGTRKLDAEGEAPESEKSQTLVDVGWNVGFMYVF